MNRKSEISIRMRHLLVDNGECSRHPYIYISVRCSCLQEDANMQNSILISDALKSQTSGITVEDGIKAIKSEIKKFAKTKSETFSYLCEETVTYGEVAKTMLGMVALLAFVFIGGFLFGGEVM